MLGQSMQNPSLAEQKRVEQGDLLGYGCIDFILGHICLMVSCPGIFSAAVCPDILLSVSGLCRNLIWLILGRGIVTVKGCNFPCCLQDNPLIFCAGGLL